MGDLIVKLWTCWLLLRSRVLTLLVVFMLKEILMILVLEIRDLCSAMPLMRLRSDGTLWWASPDTKTQVTAEYVFDKGACVPIRVHTVVVSCQHSEKVTLEDLRKDIMDKVVYTTIPKKYLDAETKFHINPCGNFVIGGPMGDAGLTGRKIIVDTYGGWGAHGGGAFSGKDYTKVDRSAAY